MGACFSAAPGPAVPGPAAAEAGFAGHGAAGAEAASAEPSNGPAGPSADSVPHPGQKPLRPTDKSSMMSVDEEEVEVEVQPAAAEAAQAAALTADPAAVVRPHPPDMSNSKLILSMQLLQKNLALHGPTFRAQGPGPSASPSGSAGALNPGAASAPATVGAPVISVWQQDATDSPHEQAGSRADTSAREFRITNLLQAGHGHQQGAAAAPGGPAGAPAAVVKPHSAGPGAGVGAGAATSRQQSTQQSTDLRDSQRIGSRGSSELAQLTNRLHALIGIMGGLDESPPPQASAAYSRLAASGPARLSALGLGGDAAGAAASSSGRPTIIQLDTLDSDVADTIHSCTARTVGSRPEHPTGQAAAAATSPAPTMPESVAVLDQALESRAGPVAESLLFDEKLCMLRPGPSPQKRPLSRVRTAEQQLVRGDTANSSSSSVLNAVGSGL